MKKIIWALVFVTCAASAATLTEEEQAKCTAEGGCVFVSKAKLDELAAKLYQLGLERGRISCGNRT